LKNLREAIERLFERESEAIAQALKPAESAQESVVAKPAEPAPGSRILEPETPAIEDRPAAETPAIEDRPAAETPPPPQPVDPATVSPRQQAHQARRRRRVERFDRVHELGGVLVVLNGREADPFSERPHMIRQARRHRWCPLLPMAIFPLDP
jgi:hypothetical protein